MKPPSYGPIPLPSNRPSFGPSYIPPEGWGRVTVLDEPDSIETNWVCECALQSGNEKHGSNSESGVGYHANLKAKDKSVRVEPNMSDVKIVANIALESYNKDRGSNYEFVEGLCNPFLEGGVWLHISFKAKDKSISDEDSPMKIFFAELEATRAGFDVTACQILDGLEQVRGCLQCDNDFLHPTSGFQRGVSSVIRIEEMINMHLD